MSENCELKIQEEPKLEENGLLPYYSWGHHSPVTFLKAVHDYRVGKGHLDEIEMNEAMVKQSVATERIDMGGKALIELSEAPRSEWVTYLEGPASAAT